MTPSSATVNRIGSVLAKVSAVTLMTGALFIAGFGADAPQTTELRVPAQCQADPPATIVLVAIDGVRWQEVYEGTDSKLGDGAKRSARELTPNLHALADRGVALGAPGSGESFSASGPNFVSLPGYTEMLTGQPATCLENDCTDPPSFTLLDAFAAGRDPRKVASLSSWTNIEHIAASHGSPALVSAGRTGGDTRNVMEADPMLAGMLERDESASPSPGWGDYRADMNTTELALGYLEHEQPSFLFVSLGDTDEYAHQGDYSSYLAALQRADDFIGDVMDIADEWKREGRETVIVVTTDHGRADDFKDHGRDYPESARTWLVAAGGPIPAQGFVASSQTRYLRDIAPTLAAIAGVPLEMGPSSGTVMSEMVPCR
ncbi:MAG: sulfatase-like hydrolase/transferase [Polyangiaceae bacterium]|nr:sulfatase-like hydrolase/transferase [Polyangiaceae bacterium]